MGGWIDNNLGVVLTIVGWIVVTIIWAMNQKGRIDLLSSRLQNCEDADRMHGRTWGSLDQRLRVMDGKLNRLLGASHISVRSDDPESDL